MMRGVALRDRGKLFRVRLRHVSDWTGHGMRRVAREIAPAAIGVAAMAKISPIVSIIDRKLDQNRFREQHWEGSFWDYLEILNDTPTVARNAFQRVYDMILSYG